MQSSNNAYNQDKDDIMDNSKRKAIKFTSANGQLVMKMWRLTEVATSRSGIRLFSRTFSSFENNLRGPINYTKKQKIPIQILLNKCSLMGMSM